MVLLGSLLRPWGAHYAGHFSGRSPEAEVMRVSLREAPEVPARASHRAAF